MLKVMETIGIVKNSVEVEDNSKEIKYIKEKLEELDSKNLYDINNKINNNFFNVEKNIKNFKILIGKHSRIFQINLEFIEKKSFKSQNSFTFWYEISRIFFEINNTCEKIEEHIDLFNYII